MDPLNAIASVITGWNKERHFQQWCKLVFAIAFSGAVTFCYSAGGMLVGTSKLFPPLVSLLVSVGTGLISAAVSMTVVFRRSPLTKGMLVALPADEAKTELETNVQVISK